MSRIGNKAITIPNGVKIQNQDGVVKVEGAKEQLTLTLPALTKVEVTGNQLSVLRADDSRKAKAMHGLARSLVNNMILGVTGGFKKNLEIIGIGYKSQVTGQKMTLTLGYSHPIVYDIPQGVKVTVTDNTKILVEGADKQMVGEVAATIRRFRKPEPYKGKGIRYVGEFIAMKEGKTVGK